MSRPRPSSAAKGMPYAASEPAISCRERSSASTPYNRTAKNRTTGEARSRTAVGWTGKPCVTMYASARQHRIQSLLPRLAGQFAACSAWPDMRPAVGLTGHSLPAPAPTQLPNHPHLLSLQHRGGQRCLQPHQPRHRPKSWEHQERQALRGTRVIVSDNTDTKRVGLPQHGQGPEIRPAALCWPSSSEHMYATSPLLQQPGARHASCLATTALCCRTGPCPKCTHLQRQCPHGELYVCPPHAAQQLQGVGQHAQHTAQGAPKQHHGACGAHGGTRRAPITKGILLHCASYV